MNKLLVENEPLEMPLPKSASYNKRPHSHRSLNYVNPKDVALWEERRAKRRVPRLEASLIPTSTWDIDETEVGRIANGVDAKPARVWTWIPPRQEPCGTPMFDYARRGTLLSLIPKRPCYFFGHYIVRPS